MKEGAPGALPGPGVGVRGREQNPPFLPAGSWGIPAPYSIPSSKPATGLGLVSSLGFEGGGRKDCLYKTQSTPKGTIGRDSEQRFLDCVKSLRGNTHIERPLSPVSPLSTLLSFFLKPCQLRFVFGRPPCPPAVCPHPLLGTSLGALTGRQRGLSHLLW